MPHGTAMQTQTQRRPHGRLGESRGSEEALEAIQDAGFGVFYDIAEGKMVFDEMGEEAVRAISRYAFEGANEGTQHSELIAASIRYVAVNGLGENPIADAVYGRFASV